MPAPLTKVFDALYKQFDFDLPEATYQKGVTGAVDGLFSNLSGGALDDAVTALLQFQIPESMKARILGHCRTRGESIVPYLKKYRDRPFVLPRKYEYSMRSSPGRRRMAYDEVLLDLKQTNLRFGLKPGVLSLVRPVLDGFAGPNWEEGYTEARKIFETHTPEADEALAILLDYGSDAGYSQELEAEIVERGEPMLRWLRKYQHQPNYALAAKYETSLQRPGVERSHQFEWFIELIVLHEKMMFSSH